MSGNQGITLGFARTLDCAVKASDEQALLRLALGARYRYMDAMLIPWHALAQSWRLDERQALYCLDRVRKRKAVQPVAEVAA